ncbi:hypothetical protein Poli38472_007802 [Pythium oligandrum]|uniref:Uncharacterized protein n=1 Tax=Pythium oligandrum TaxID=41045 RepID=A0A8K1FLD5_PYTOL|nr:hypothetical protein Poli38472_007802 [Pythium oligandrum]|eukprot:TMW68130.1 hypothetical protein Poli38472_007802 [Pythium oligandrum]
MMAKKRRMRSQMQVVDVGSMNVSETLYPNTPLSMDTESFQALLASFFPPENSSAESDEPMVRIDSSESETTAPVAPMQSKKRRKTSNDMRKEEKTSLLHEIKTLNAHLVFMRKQAMGHEEGEGESMITPMNTNIVLREMKLNQCLQVAANCAIASHTIALEMAHPLLPKLVLGSDKAQCQKALADVQATQLALARKYIEERTLFLDHSQYHHTSEAISSIEVKKGVYDAICYYMTNIELALIADGGFFTFREDDDLSETGIHQNCLVTAAPGVLVEAKTAVFYAYDPVVNVAVITGRYVDEDELCPYVPKERIRLDAITMAVISQLPGSETTVVRQWIHTRLVSSDHIALTDAFLRHMRPSIGRWAETLHDLVRQRLEIGENMTGIVTDQASQGISDP